MQIDVSDYENWIGKTQEIEDKLEVSTARKISTLLGLEDKDFILIRNRVKDSL